MRGKEGLFSFPGLVMFLISDIISPQYRSVWVDLTHVDIKVTGVLWPVTTIFWGLCIESAWSALKECFFPIEIVLGPITPRQALMLGHHFSGIDGGGKKKEPICILPPMLSDKWSIRLSNHLPGAIKIPQILQSPDADVKMIR